MELRGPDRDVELIRNVFRATAGSDQFQHFALTSGQVRAASGSRTALSRGIRQKRVALQNGMQSCKEILSWGVLRQVRFRSQVGGLFNIFRLVVHGQENDGKLRLFLKNGFGSGKPVATWHTYVQDCDIRVELVD